MTASWYWLKSSVFNAGPALWKFETSGPLVGNTIDEMKRVYERQRDEAFKAHVCSKYPKS